MRLNNTSHHLKAIIIITLIFLSFETCTTEETLLQIQGTVTDATDNSPITGAVVQLKLTPVTLTPGEEAVPIFLAEASADNNGSYYLKYLRKGNCKLVENDFFLTAMKTGAGYLYDSEAKYHMIRCTEEIQTVDFQLRRR